MRVASFGLLSLSLILTSCGSGGGSSSNESNPTPQITVTVTAAATTVLVGRTVQMQATVSGTSNTAVAWAVNGAPGGSAANGTIDSMGLYTAPATVPSMGAVTITATSQSDSTRAGSIIINLQYPVPKIGTVTPSMAQVAAPSTLITISGDGIVQSSIVQLDGTNLQTSNAANGQITALVPAQMEALAANRNLQISNPSPGGGASPPFQWTVSNPLPTLISATPASIAITNNPVLVQIFGINFDPGITATINGQAAQSLTYRSTSEVNLLIPASFLQDNTNLSLVVANTGPGGGKSNTLPLVVGSGAASETDESPATGVTAPGPTDMVVLAGTSAGTATPAISMTAQARTASAEACQKETPIAEHDPRGTCIQAAASTSGGSCIGNVPWIPQVGPPGTKSIGQTFPGYWTIPGTDDGTHNCGPASLSMVQGWLLHKSGIETWNSFLDNMCLIYEPQTAPSFQNCKVRSDTSANGNEHDRGPQTLVQDWLSALGMSSATAVVGDASLNLLSDQISKGFPVIASVQTQMCGVGHYMVVVGIDQNYVYVNDAGRSEQTNGQYVGYSRTNFARAWGVAPGAYSAIVFDPTIGILSNWQLSGDGNIQEPAWAVNVQRTDAFRATGPATSYEWSISPIPSNSDSFPSWLKLTSNNNVATISGTPTSVGQYEFFLSVKDPTDIYGFAADRAVSLNVVATNSPILSISNGTTTPTWQVGVDTNYGLNVLGALGTPTWTAISTPPSGLTLAPDGTVSGKPTTSGLQSWTVQVQDSGGAPPLTASLTSFILPSVRIPTIQSIDGPSNPVGINSAVPLKCNANDPDTTNLSFSWSATAGQLSVTTSPSLTWTSPSTPGVYTLTCAVSTQNPQATQVSTRAETTLLSAEKSLSIPVTSALTAHFNISGNGQTLTDGQTLSATLPRNGNIALSLSSTSIPGSSPIAHYKWASNGTQICTDSSSCQYTFGTPANTITLTITDANGQTATATAEVNLSFQSAAPTISVYSWGAETAGVSFSGTVSGTNFDSSAQVWFCQIGGNCNQQPAAGVTVNSASSVSVTNVNLSSAGTYQFYVQTTAGQSSRSSSFTVSGSTAPAPAISSISPSSPTASTSNQTITVYGSNFQSGLTVTAYFPGGGSTTLSGTQIQNVTSSSFQLIITFANSGSWGIRVTNPDTQQSGTFSFTVSGSTAPAPAISSISPSSPTASTSNQTITVYGSNFQSGLTVTAYFPGGGSTTLSGTQIQNVTSSSFQLIITFANSGSWGIRVTNPDTQQSGTFSFTVSGSTAPAPAISSISPSSPTASTSNQTITVYGSNFQSGLTVTAYFPGGGSTTLSGTQIQNVTSSSFQLIITFANSGSWGIRVTNPDTQQSGTFSFTVSGSTAPAPAISSISPSSPTASTSNQTITVYGSNFQSGLTVTAYFPGGGSTTLSGTQIQNVTSSSFQLIITFANSGSWGIRVTNPDTQQSGTFSFTVSGSTAPAPAISSISPSSPTASTSNQTITVYGSNFQSGLTVTAYFPGGGSTTLSGTQIQNVTSSSFQLIITFANSGSWGIRVTNPDTQQSGTFSFTVSGSTAPAPAISSISPSSPTASTSNQTITVYGSNFQSGLTVTAYFPGGGSTTLSGTQIQNVTSSSFQLIITFANSGSWGIRVTNPDTQQSGTFSFTVSGSTAPAPAISSISPSSPTASTSNQTITVYGSNFQSGLTVTAYFPGGGSTTLSGTQIQNVTSSSFQLIITFANSGSWGIRVTNPDTQQSGTFSFTVSGSTAPAPAISSISPSSPTASTSNQTITVYGSNFQSGLTVTAYFPGGGSTTLSGTQIQNVTSSSFQLIITFANSGSWGIRVTNPDTQQSGTFSFTVH